MAFFNIEGMNFEQAKASINENLGGLQADFAAGDKKAGRYIGLFHLMAAAERDDITSQVALGHLYEFGVIVDRDEEAARYWYGRALKQDHPKADGTMLATAAAEGMKRFQSLHMQTLPNARELGGYTGHDGKKVVRGRLLRTAVLREASEQDLKRLADEYNLKLILDLRAGKEAQLKPDPVPPGVRYVHIEVMDPGRFSKNNEKDAVQRTGEMTFEEFAVQLEKFTTMPGIENLYASMLESEFGAAGYAKAFREILDCPDGAVLFHCAAGKDRTGVLAALLLTALGVDRRTIRMDYLLTNYFCADRIEDTKRKLMDIGYPEEKAGQITKIWEGASDYLLENAFRAMEESDGSATGYLKNRLHLTDEDIETLKERYLE